MSLVGGSCRIVSFGSALQPMLCMLLGRRGVLVSYRCCTGREEGRRVCQCPVISEHALSGGVTSFEATSVAHFGQLQSGSDAPLSNEGGER